MRIGIISDTHGIFREQWKDILLTCDSIFHLGDVNTQKCYERFEKLGKPFYAVRGNCDYGEFAKYLPVVMKTPFKGKLFCLAHKKEDLPFDLTDCDFIICGHTHCYQNDELFGKVYLNPGSASM